MSYYYFFLFFFFLKISNDIFLVIALFFICVSPREGCSLLSVNKRLIFMFMLNNYKKEVHQFAIPAFFNESGSINNTYVK
jgi:hypothetical protein